MNDESEPCLKAATSLYFCISTERQLYSLKEECLLALAQNDQAEGYYEYYEEAMESIYLLE